MKGLIAFWKTPTSYFSEKRESWIWVLLPGFFCFLFLVFFQPFGVNNYDPSEKITSLFFSSMALMGFTVSLGLAFNEFFLRRHFFRAQVTQGKQILWIAWTIVWLSTLIFLLYNFLGNWHDLRFRSYLEFIGNTGAMFAFPAGMAIWYLHYKNLRSTSYALSQEPKPANSRKLLEFNSTNGKDLLVTAESQVLIIESHDNYATIYYLVNQQIQRHLIRSSLKRLEKMLEGTSLLRCHRAFIVNAGHIASWRSGKKGLKLSLRHFEKEIPVSRSYRARVQSGLKEQMPSVPHR